MRYAAMQLTSFLLAACASGAHPGPPVPDVQRPAILAAPTEVIVTFPADTSFEFPWPAKRLGDRFDRPFWSLVAYGRANAYAAVAVRFKDDTSQTMRAFRDLNAVMAHTGLYNCSHDTHVIVCFTPLAGTLTVRGGQLIVKVTDTTWVAEFNRVRPDSGWLRVDRSHGTPPWTGRVAVQYAPRGGA